MLMLCCRYPGALDTVLVDCVGVMCSAQQKNLLHHFLSLTMCCGKYQVGRVGFVCLFHSACRCSLRPGSEWAQFFKISIMKRFEDNLDYMFWCFLKLFKI